MNYAFDELLIAYGVKILLNDGDLLQMDIKALQINMDVIRTTNKQVSASLSRLTGSLKLLYDLITAELIEVCKTDIGLTLNVECQTLQVRLYLYFIINEADSN